MNQQQHNTFLIIILFYSTLPSDNNTSPCSENIMVFLIIITIKYLFLFKIDKNESTFIKCQSVRLEQCLSGDLPKYWEEISPRLRPKSVLTRGPKLNFRKKKLVHFKFWHNFDES